MMHGETVSKIHSYHYTTLFLTIGNDVTIEIAVIIIEYLEIIIT